MLTALLLVFALLAAACGDDDAVTTTTDSASTPVTATTSAAPSTTAATGATTTAPAASTTTGGAAATSDVEALLEVFNRTPARLTYQIGQQADETTIILAQDPTASPPVESIQQPLGGLKIIIADTVIVCDPDSGCFQVPGGNGLDGFTSNFLGPLVGSYLALAAQTGSTIGDVETTSDTIAGRSGVCFTFTPNDPTLTNGGTEFIRQCVDAELGFTLLLEARETGGELETVLLLLEYAPPTAADFEPTGTVQTIPQP